MAKNVKRCQQLTRYFKCLLIAGLALGAISCSTFVRKEEMGVVIARRAQMRSSTAVVAADLLEVERGDVVEILDSTTAENGERWLRVSARDADRTEGWIEARNIMSQKLLDLSRKLAEESKNIPSQATGQLRASTNLRLSPNRSVDDNILMKLDSGSTFEIVGWKRLPKSRAIETAESDDTPKLGSPQQQDSSKKAPAKTSETPAETSELWYSVRLSPLVSPAPAGWLYGKQVELMVPSDIIFYRTGREFVAWQSLDEEAIHKSTSVKDKDAAKLSRPSSWVVLEKKNFNEASVNDPDFDRIFVLGYNNSKQEHYTAYRSSDIDGRLPLRIEEQGGSRFFVVNIRNSDGQVKEARYRVDTNHEGILKVEPLNEEAKGKKKR